MKQLIQDFKTGLLYVDELPIPSLTEASVLVENHFSLISAGTEKSTIKVAQSSLIGKAKQRPDLVAQVLQNIKKEGIKATLGKVRTKLDSLKALGYSTAGTVLASMDTNKKFKAGDRVACAGQDYASHADIVCIPQNLVVKIPDNVSFEEASFTTLGAIALQGVRQANPTLGESVCVIGLGLLGQITCQLLSANGCRVFGIDVSKNMVGLASKIEGVVALERGDLALMSAIETFTRGYGFDKVLITAATTSNDPIELSAVITKKKGVVVVVGAVKMDIARDPHFYRKELELRMSCSYGPGRYDEQYEQYGHDYPHAYVRWTEQRNMEAFLDLVSLGKIDLKSLITHIFDIEDAVKAYDLILGKTNEPYVGILLKYTQNSTSFKHSIDINKKKTINSGNLCVSFIGAGSFAQSYLLPNLKSLGIVFDSVVTNTGINAKNVAEKFSFRRASTNPELIFSDTVTEIVFVASRHDSHAKYLVRAIENKKHVFIEKPLCINYDEYQKLKPLLIDSSRNTIVMVGFNRRFSPLAIHVKNLFKGIKEPVFINIRINAGAIPREHWIQQAHIGGGRIIGEICHFVDLMQFFTDAYPVKVYANSLGSLSNKEKNDDNVVICIQFSDGSLGSLVYLANGDKSLPKEQIEVFSAGKVGIINDFRSAILYANNTAKKVNLSGKGHKEEISKFIDAVRNTGIDPIPVESLLYTTVTTFKIIDSLSTGMAQDIML